MLLEEGFQVTSVDASDKMLKQALKLRWERRKEEIFDKWGKLVNKYYIKTMIEPKKVYMIILLSIKKI